MRREGTGPVIVLVHGVGTTMGCWNPVVPLLAARHELVLVDVPGFGGSPPPSPDEPPAPHVLATCIAEQLDRLGLDRPLLVGNSLGGEIVLDLGRRGRARAVVALSPSGLSSTWEREFVLSTLGAAHLGFRAIAPFAAALCRNIAFRTAAFAQLHSRPWRKDPVQAAEDVRNTAQPYYQRCLRAVESRSALDWLPDVHVPALVAFGSQDRVLGAHQGRRFVEELPDGRFERLPGAGHMPMNDQPELVARTILDFFAERG